MIILKIINELSLAFVEAIIFLVFFVSFTQSEGYIYKNKLKCFLFVISYILFSSCIGNYLPLGINSASYVFFTIITLSFITRTNIYNTLIIVLITGLYISLLDYLVSLGFCNILSINLTQLLNHPVYFIVFSFTAKAIQIGFSIYLIKINKGKIRVNIFKSNNSQYMFIVMQFFIMVIFLVCINYSFGSNKITLVFSITWSFFFLLNLIFAIYDIKEREALLKIVNREKNLEEYVKNLEDVINVIRREKHDFMNHIQTIFAISKLKKSNALSSIENYLSKLINDLETSYKFYESGNDYIDGLMAIKSNICFENKIKLNVNIGISFEFLDADESDIAGITGNILNNSIECLMKDVDNENKQIDIETALSNGKFLLMISNNGPEIIKANQYKIFDKGFTTKPDSSEHGFGLFITRQLVEKNKGKIRLYSDPLTTKFLLEFGLKEDNNYEVDIGCIACQNQGVQS